MFCIKCGTSIPDNGSFCPKCGTPALIKLAMENKSSNNLQVKTPVNPDSVK